MCGHSSPTHLQQELALRQAGIHPLLAAHYSQQLAAGGKDTDPKQQQLLLQALGQLGNTDSKELAALQQLQLLAQMGGGGGNEDAMKQLQLLAQMGGGGGNEDAMKQLQLLAQMGGGGNEDAMKQLQALTQAELGVKDLAALQQLHVLNQIEMSAQDAGKSIQQVSGVYYYFMFYFLQYTVTLVSLIYSHYSSHSVWLYLGIFPNEYQVSM